MQLIALLVGRCLAVLIMLNFDHDLFLLKITLVSTTIVSTCARSPLLSHEFFIFVAENPHFRM